MKRFHLLTLIVSIFVPLALFGEPKRISHTAAVESATAKVVPHYSPIAKQLKIEESVQLDAGIVEDGTVEKVDVVSGNPVLTKPTAEALKKWRFKPFVDGDKDVK